MLPVQVKILDNRLLDNRLEENSLLPSYGSDKAAGLDLRAMPEEDLVLKPNECKLVSTGISVYLQHEGYVGFILPRSGTGHKKGIVLGNLTGVIDSDYQGPLMLSLWNRTDTEVTISVGERVAQYVVLPCMQINMQIVDEFGEKTTRAEGGFGSTGQH